MPGGAGGHDTNGMAAAHSDYQHGIGVAALRPAALGNVIDHHLHVLVNDAAFEVG